MTIDEGFRLLPKASQDIVDIWEFIDERNPSAASRFVEEILDDIRNLAVFPNQGHRRPDLSARPVRFQSIRDYLIAYAPDEEPLVILAVIHGRRDPRVIAATLRGREDLK